MRAILLVLLLGLGCATTSLSGFDEPGLPELIERYKALGGEKSLALATEANGRFAWAISAGEPSQIEATQLALERCRKAARSGGMRSDCYAFAIGDEAAPETVRKCTERRLGSRRCEMQKAHQGLLQP